MENEKQSAGDVGTILLTGDLTISRAAELKALMRETLAEYAAVCIQFEGVTSVDLSCLQLLCSVHRTASAMNRPLRFSGSRPDIFRRAIQQAGFTRQQACGLTLISECLWRGGE